MGRMNDLMMVSEEAKDRRKHNSCKEVLGDLTRSLIDKLGYEIYMSNDVTYGDEHHKFDYLLNLDGKPVIAIIKTPFPLSANKLSKPQLERLIDIGVDGIKAVIITNELDYIFISMDAYVYFKFALDKISFSEAEKLLQYSKEQLGTMAFLADADNALCHKRAKDNKRTSLEGGSDTVINMEKASRATDFDTWNSASDKIVVGIKKCPIMKMVILGHVYDLQDCNTYGQIIINILLNLKDVGKLTRENLKDSTLGHRKYGFHDSPDGMRTAKYINELNLYFDSTMTGDTFVRIINYLISEYGIGERGILVKFA
jgi:hypothetical protein